MSPFHEPEIFGRLFRADAYSTEEQDIAFEFYPEQNFSFSYSIMFSPKHKLATDPVTRVAQISKDIWVFCTQNGDFVLEICHLLEE